MVEERGMLGNQVFDPPNILVEHLGIKVKTRCFFFFLTDEEPESHIKLIAQIYRDFKYNSRLYVKINPVVF